MHINVSRRNFIQGLAGASALALGGCCCPFRFGPKAKIAVQLYSIRDYIKAVGIEKALEDVSKIGYRGVEFAGYWGKDAATLKKLLDDNGLVACGTHINRSAFGPDQVAKTCEFNLTFGNRLLICPGGGNFPGQGDKDFDAFMKNLVDFYNRAAVDAAKYGCKVGLHNHTNEFQRKLSDGTTYWDYFFSHTVPEVCMEQDVGWTTCAGDTIPGVNPMVQYKKYPHRSPTLHAKENGMGRGVVKFDAILGKPGCDANGKPCATPVDWDALIPVTEEDGVEWYVVECERHAGSLGPITESYAFLKAKGLN